MAKLTNTQLAERVRSRNKENVIKMRERQQEAGNIYISVWVSAAAKERINAIAKAKHLSMGEVVTLAMEQMVWPE